jgi:hypothetical protein
MNLNDNINLNNNKPVCHWTHTKILLYSYYII